MAIERALHYGRVWLRNLWSVQALNAVLASFGALWLVVEITAFFTIGTDWPDKIRRFWAVFGFSGVIFALFSCRPKLSYKCKVGGRDTTIEIAVGDLFSYPGAIIVGGNTTFDTRISKELISERSIQGVFTRKYYSDEAQLDREIAAGLAGQAGEQLVGKRLGNSVRYRIGTCVRLNPKQRMGYFLAIADINEHGVASGSLGQLQDALACLWEFVGTRGLKEPLVMPVLGTGFSRLKETREQVIQEIIRSFIAACSERTFTDHLTVVIAPQDMIQHGMSLSRLELFLQHECAYSSPAPDKYQVTGHSA